MNYYYANIEQDTDVIHPRDKFNHYSTLYTWHTRYSIGGKEDKNHQEPITNLCVWAFNQFNELTISKEIKKYTSHEQTMYFNDEELNQEQFNFFVNFVQEWLDANFALLPIYMYDHFGITISTGPFDCPFDNGQIGIIYIKKSTCERIGISLDDAREILKRDIEEINNYLTGNVFSISIYETDEEEYDGDIIYEDEITPKNRKLIECVGGYYGYNSTFSQSEILLATYQKERETETV